MGLAAVAISRTDDLSRAQAAARDEGERGGPVVTPGGRDVAAGVGPADAGCPAHLPPGNDDDILGEAKVLHTEETGESSDHLARFVTKKMLHHPGNVPGWWCDVLARGWVHPSFKGRRR